MMGDRLEQGPSTKAFYRPEDVRELDYNRDLGDPGEYPFTRGVYRTMYRGRLWTMRQYSGFGTAEESNARYKMLLDQGQTGLSVALDLPTQLGLDSDDPMAEGEVGRVGVAVDTLKDMEILFRDLPIDEVGTSFTINATAPILLAMYIVVGEKQGIPASQLRGTIQNDILKEYIARGTWIFPPEPSIRLAIDAIQYCTEEAPKFNPISISGYHIREAGSTAVQELAYTLANALVYVQAAVERGLNVDEFGPRLSFFFSAHRNLFEEIAKFRAARRLWARIMKQRFNTREPKACRLRFGIGCSGSTLQAEQPLNNVVRVAYEALSAVLGGAQSVFTCAWDEAFTIPTDASAELALRTQQILAYESGVPDVVDPLGGSYYVESLTNAMEARAEELMKRIEDEGGMVAAIKRGHVQGAILDEAYAKQQAVRSGERVVVGVNRFQREDSNREKRQRDMEVYEPNAGGVRRQMRRLERVKVERDERSVRRVLLDLREAAQTEANLMPHLIRAAREYATVGEMTAVLKDCFGEYREPLHV